MDAIHKMNAKELLNELKTYNQYKNQTDYYIKKSIGGKKQATVDELKNELIKLSKPTITNTKSCSEEKKPKEAKSVEDNVQIKVGHEIYTEDQLLEMIQFYKQHHKQYQDIVNIPQDILEEIMLNADIKTINQYCLTNTNALKLCQNHQFWNSISLLLVYFVRYPRPKRKF